MEHNHASSSADGAGEGGAIAPGSVGPVLQGDVSCVRCSYNLRGLPPNRNCPECGEPIANSLKGFTLQAASAEYRAALKAGLSLVLNSILLLIVASIAMIVVRVALSGQAWLGTILDGVVFLIGCAMLLGYWKYTEPDPGYVNFEQPSSARKVVRVSVMLSAVISLAQFMLGLLTGGTADGMSGGMAGASAVGTSTLFLTLLVGLASFVVWIVQFIGVMNYTSWIGGRVPDDFVVRRARMYRWLLPVIYVVGAIVVIGPLIALVMYWNLLDRVRKHLKAIEATGAPAELPKRLA